MEKLNIQKIESAVLLILKKNNLSSKVNISKQIKETLEKQENNLRFIARAKNGKRYIVKYSLAGLTEKTKHTGIRAKLNLENEARFYKETDLQPKKKIIIPKLLDSSTGKDKYIIIEFLEGTKIFKPTMAFSKTPYPEFLIKSIIDGIEEFQNLKVNKKLFNYTDSQDISSWVESLSGAYQGKLLGLEEKVKSIFSKNWTLWDNNLKYINHMDIHPDTFGYDIKTHKFLLLDFEKAQISHMANDFSSFTTNPLIRSWNMKFEEQLLKKYNNKNFTALYRLSLLLRLLSKLNNYRTGRLDHIFTEILGAKKFNSAKKTEVPLLEKEILEIIEKL